MGRPAQSRACCAPAGRGGHADGRRLGRGREWRSVQRLRRGVWRLRRRRPIRRRRPPLRRWRRRWAGPRLHRLRQVMCTQYNLLQLIRPAHIPITKKCMRGCAGSLANASGRQPAASSQTNGMLEYEGDSARTSARAGGGGMRGGNAGGGCAGVTGTCAAAGAGGGMVTPGIGLKPFVCSVASTPFAWAFEGGPGLQGHSSALASVPNQPDETGTRCRKACCSDASTC